ncbi:hypothetical protein LZA78_03815 [Sinirhodobacter sp. WL0062]|uniref:DUF1376 domain-containing protein n=1 Tax=Rhodobacter flavimaris TaxID=2907145 RepID=A0ABS8YVR8_9RHOB|nr:hypothetical protein [Sinirhodobacter sp. WL0062]MCE5972602.1 hypothetical protein [Sinirhodobacter sp. WL0062]
MGMKSKVRSMQRGAQKRSDGAPVTNAELYGQSPPLLTDDELANFKFGNRSIDDFFLGLDDILRACHRSHLAAGDVAKVLNKQQARTACGAPWTPRLAWFLMKTWRTVHIQKQEVARQKRQASEQFKRSAKPDHADDSPIERAVAHQKTRTFQKVLRNYFKNPTLGEIFPELGALKQTLLDQGGPAPGVQRAPPAHLEPPLASRSKTKPIKQQDGGRSRAKKPETQTRAKTVASQNGQFNGWWKDFFTSAGGGSYLADLVRSNPRLLELAGLRDVRFLGALRARKSAHPDGLYWTEADAEQVRLAILAGMHQQGDT